jgi:predicted RNase H-like nuclease (RuvC/YqgF family)
MVDKDTTMVGFATATEKTIRTMSEKLEELFREIGKLKGDINQQGIEIERLQEKKED